MIIVILLLSEGQVGEDRPGTFQRRNALCNIRDDQTEK